MYRELRKIQFLVMLSLLRMPLHEYAIRQEVFELTGHNYFPAASTIRRAVDGLLVRKYVEECYSDPDYWLKARRGAPYELNEQGQKRLRIELLMYRDLIDQIRIGAQAGILGPHWTTK